MLWLTGLLGIAGVGAAAMVTIGTGDEVDALDEEDSENLSEVADASTDSIFDWIGETEALKSNVNPASDNQGVSDEDIYAALAEERGDLVMPNEAHGTAEAESAEAEFPAANIMDDARLMPGADNLTNWLGTAPDAEPLDYDAGRDSLVLVWDDHADATEPDVTILPDPDDSEVMQVRIGDRIVADVYGDSDLQVSDVVMIPLSSAKAVGLAPA